MKISQLAKSIAPYTAGEQPQDKAYIKLNTNENPYPPAPACKRVLEEFDIERLKLYPDISALALRTAIAEKEGVDLENVFVGNGSDEVLSFALRAFYDSFAAPVKFASVTYSFYPVFCNLYGINYEQAENAPDFKVEVESLAGGQGAVLANPNAPTSIEHPLEEIERLLSLYEGKPVIVDEAYIDFAEKTSTAAPLIKRYENLAVVKTFSKSYSLAGIRCGYMIASKELVSALERIRDSFNSYPVDSVCQAVCRAAVLEQDYHSRCVASVCATRERVSSALIAAGRRVLPSQTNFLFVSGGKEDYLKLKERGVLVRFFDKPRIGGYTRVSIGSDAEMDAYLNALLN